MRINLVLGIMIFVFAAVVAVGGCSDSRSVDGPPGFFVGSVLDKATMAGIDSAAISVGTTADTSAGGFTHRYTDTTGYYKLSAGYRKGTFYIVARKQGYATAVRQVTLAGDSVSADFELEREE
jgi:hypothetical protein